MPISITGKFDKSFAAPFMHVSGKVWSWNAIRWCCHCGKSSKLQLFCSFWSRDRCDPINSPPISGGRRHFQSKRDMFTRWSLKILLPTKSFCVVTFLMRFLSNKTVAALFSLIFPPKLALNACASLGTVLSWGLSVLYWRNQQGRRVSSMDACVRACGRPSLKTRSSPEVFFTED